MLIDDVTREVLASRWWKSVAIEHGFGGFLWMEFDLEAFFAAIKAFKTIFVWYNHQLTVQMNN